MSVANYKKVYSYAPTAFLEEMTKKKARDFCLTAVGMSDQNQLDEANGIIEAYNERRNQSVSSADITIKTSCKEDDQNVNEKLHEMELEATCMLNYWIGDNLRPELLAERTYKLLDACYGKISCVDNSSKQLHKGEMQKELLEVFADFHEEYYDVINSNDYYAENVRQASHERNMTATEGLGFGLITTSVSNALLYEFMNSRAHNTQRQRNIYNYRNSVNLSLSGIAENMERTVQRLYDNLISAIEAFFARFFADLKEMTKQRIVSDTTELSKDEAISVNQTASVSTTRKSCVSCVNKETVFSSRFEKIIEAFENLTTVLEEILNFEEKVGVKLIDYLNEDILAFMAYLVVDENYTVTEAENNLISKIVGEYYDGRAYAEVVNNSRFKNNAWKYTKNTNAGEMIDAIVEIISNEDIRNILYSHLKECGNELIICNGYMNDKALTRFNAFFA